jgi:hypothetical protein
VRVNSVEVTTKGTIASGSLGAGDSGIIEINAGNLPMLDGGTIFSSAMGAGQGGDIIINADRVVVSGGNSEPFIYTSQPANQLSLGVSGISSQVGVNGASSQVGGKVRITTGSIEPLDGPRITTQTFSAGNAGYIDVTADRVIISGANARSEICW